MLASLVLNSRLQQWHARATSPYRAQAPPPPASQKKVVEIEFRVDNDVCIERVERC